LKACGVKSESDWKRMGISTAVTFVTYNALVQGLKFVVSEERPDGSNNHSFPSSHTAAAFAGASLLHREYGARYPWISVAGYSVAAYTGISRILHNRHSAGDVLVGAGIGALSTDVGYLLTDLLMRITRIHANTCEWGTNNANNANNTNNGEWGTNGERINADDANGMPMGEHAIRLNLSMGVGFNNKYLDVPEIYTSSDGQSGNSVGANPLGLKLRMGRTATFSAEGVYGLNKYIGVCGRVSMSTMPLAANAFNNGYNYYPSCGLDVADGSAAQSYRLAAVESIHLNALGMYAGLSVDCPVNDRLSVGAKFLVGDRMAFSSTADGYFKKSIATVLIPMSKYTEMKDVEAMSRTGVGLYRQPAKVGEDMVTEHDFLRLKANNSAACVAGVSLTYYYKPGSVLRLYADYDVSRPDMAYTLKNRYGENGAAERLDTYRRTMTLHTLSVGGGLSFVF
jgi:hypothetical protein